jgi:hypothetical protein
MEERLQFGTIKRRTGLFEGCGEDMEEDHQVTDGSEHETPVTSTWTSDFVTREREVHKTVGDWLRDKTISWKTWRLDGP